MKRRLFLKGSIAATSIATAIGAGMLTPTMVFASTSKFKDQSNHIGKLISNAKDGNFYFKTPEIAENGAMVPMTVDATNIDNVSSIAFYVLKNKTKLAAYFKLPNANGFITTRIKMAETSPVTALVTTTTGESFIQTKSIKVTLGGCGG
jgi:sulfur-oxidizing protein SoxY